MTCLITMYTYSFTEAENAFSAMDGISVCSTVMLMFSFTMTGLAGSTFSDDLFAVLFES